MNITDLMKQAEQLQSKMQQAQQDLANMEVEGEAGAGLVKVILTGKYDVKKVRIDPDLMAEPIEVLEDILAAAVNDGVRKVEKLSKETMNVMPNIDLPPGFKMPF